MKKTYIIPEVEIHAISVESLIAQSPLGGNDAVGNGTQLVKEDVTSSNTQNYDVWDDDWSK